MRERGFEIVSAWRGLGIKLPARKTARSAGYDIEAGIDVVLAPGQTALVPTGVKAYMLPDEVLYIYIRSSIAVKKGLALSNAVGVIDADYYNNADNEGHIYIALTNYGERAVTLAKGERIAQGIFQKYLTVDGDAAGDGAERAGGFGSTGES